MFNNTPKIKNVYVPLAVIALALVLMLVEVLFLSNDASTGALEKLVAVAVKNYPVYVRTPAGHRIM